MEQGHQLTSAWEMANPTGGIVLKQTSDECETGPLPPSALLIEGPRLLETRARLQRLGGLARPAIEQLLSSPFAPARLRGMALAHSMDIRPSDVLLARLLKDKAQVALRGKQDASRIYHPPNWEYSPLNLSIARIAADLGWDHPPDRSPSSEEIVFQIEQRLQEWFEASHVPADEASRFIDTPRINDLIHGLRQSGGYTAQTEQEYWNRARSLWWSWWRNDVLRAGDREDGHDWRNFVSRYEGKQFAWSERKPGQPLTLTIFGPAGMEIETAYLPTGRPPLPVRGAPRRAALHTRGRDPVFWSRGSREAQRGLDGCRPDFPAATADVPTETGEGRDRVVAASAVPGSSAARRLVILVLPTTTATWSGVWMFPKPSHPDASRNKRPPGALLSMRSWPRGEAPERHVDGRGFDSRRLHMKVHAASSRTHSSKKACAPSHLAAHGGEEVKVPPSGRRAR